MARVTRPDTHTITLPSGEHLFVKRRLNAGERRSMMADMKAPDGTMDGLLYDLAQVQAYLMDWDLKDDISGEPLIIRGVDKAEQRRVLDSLDPEDFKDIAKAIDEHDDNMIAERKAEKKIPTGQPPSPTALPSPGASESPTTKSTS